MRLSITLLAAAFVSSASAQTPQPAPASAVELWYAQPAPQWNEALPIGNGRIGAMVFGGANQIGSDGKSNNGDTALIVNNADIADGKHTRAQDEHLQLNEDTIWQGSRPSPIDARLNPKAGDAIPQIRKLLAEGKIKEAEVLADKDVLAADRRMPGYSTLGDLYLRSASADPVTNYRRDLQLNTGIASVSYTQGGVRYRRELFASAIDNVIILHLSADKPGKLSFRVTMDRPADFATLTEGQDRILLQPGPTHKDQIRFLAEAQILNTGGTVEADGKAVTVTGADSVIILIAAATDFKGGHFQGGDPATTCAATLKHAAAIPYLQMKAAHITDHQTYFDRVHLQLGSAADPLANIPTDERLRRESAGGSDPNLEAIYFQMGRYLLISSSRPGGMAANLQGLWASGISNPWGSKYTININTQMNYWPAEITGLGDLTAPLFDLVDMLRDPASGTGVEVAKKYYNARGFVAHHNTDIWGDAQPIDGVPYGIWPMGGAWLSLHLYDHYAFTGDKAFLAARAYPALRDASLFFLDYLTPGPKGTLVTGPSLSPENRYKLPNGESHSLTMAPTMDIEILRQLFSDTIDASNRLGIDEQFRRQVADAYQKLPPFKISKLGTLQEWQQDYDESAPGHRHISHLWALYPGNIITPEQTPDLARAAQATLQRRLDNGGGQTGWSRAWVINYWDRLRNSDEAYKSLQVLLKQSTFPDMLDDHPSPGTLGVFQIDGNLGATAGIAGMLLDSSQDSRGTQVLILPALPSAWPDGSITGLHARGGLTVDIAWQHGTATIATLRPALDATFTLHAQHGTGISTIRDNGAATPSHTTAAADAYTLTLKAGHTYTLTFTTPRTKK